MKLNKTLFALPVLVLLLVPTFSPAAAHVDLGVVVGTPPPPPPATVVAGPVGVAPGPGYVWVNGYWNWVNGGWVWVPGVLGIAAARAQNVGCAAGLNFAGMADTGANAIMQWHDIQVPGHKLLDEKIQKKRGSRVILLVHRQEP